MEERRGEAEWEEEEGKGEEGGERDMSYGVLWVPVGMLSLNRLNVRFETVIDDMTKDKCMWNLRRRNLRVKNPSV